MGDRAAVVMSEQHVHQNLLNEFVEVTVLVDSAALELQQCGTEEEVSLAASAEQGEFSGRRPSEPQGTVEAARIAGPESTERTPGGKRLVRRLSRSLRYLP